MDPDVTSTFNSTEEYCGLGKVGMADEAPVCKWPLVPPLCEQTWTEYIGPTVVLISQLFFGLIFLYALVRLIFIQKIILDKQKKKGVGFFNRSANEWNNTYNVVVAFIRLIIEIDWGNNLGFINFQTQIICNKLIAGCLFCNVYTVFWGWYKVTLEPKDRKVLGGRADRYHNFARIVTITIEFVCGILSVVTLPEEYADAGVFVGTWNAVSRAVLQVMMITLGWYVLECRNVLDSLNPP